MRKEIRFTALAAAAVMAAAAAFSGVPVKDEVPTSTQTPLALVSHDNTPKTWIKTPEPSFGIPASGKSAASSDKDFEEILAHWESSSQTKNELVSYMRSVTDKNSKDYIPEEHRIAVFDLDGTLFSETNPCYFDHQLLLYRVLEDPSYRDRATDFEKDTCAKILQWIQDGTYPENMDVEHGRAIASSFAGMTVDEFKSYVKKFGSTSAPGYKGMTRAQSLYKPMLEVIDMLDAGGFTTYVVSGTDRLIIRGGLEDTLGLPANHIIGSDEMIVASGQDGEDGLKYQFKKGDELITSGDFIIKNLKMNKVSAIEREIGMQPVLSFGNTTGDQSMADYTINGNKYKSRAFMLCCDDVDREYGNPAKARKMEDLCAEHGWVPVSMKNDWTTIYAEGVEKDPSAGLDRYDRLYEKYKYRLDALNKKLPKYEYPGHDLLCDAICDYVRDEFGSYYADADVFIPCPVILNAQDAAYSLTSDGDIDIYGIFCVYGYDLEGDTLVCVSGGSHPGCMHIRRNAFGYKVTGFDAVADGSGYTESAKEIFGKYYDEFAKAESDSDARESLRAQIIANYVSANGLSVKAYQDYGWDPVGLPASNRGTAGELISVGILDDAA